ncbi:sugar phosphate isomerase/epimerase family protein [Clostridium luticellarii]|jgi:sugar phosphate isomerase/epimerase|uniref:Fructoselysine 3-epimerase n=1 Tax=Clostridium luticellarii TaxID=1691940 RepID=A0A2T0BQD3_9CLOT|nr:sugar phosphate isomerase/epimerase [Clostridium luticellarii]MCI1944446.1 sugar phosphate isomerase/epimerase [Clostridium luticellarii]MCI1967945.1 sugar phosphate isomerase/epimerase [Clostridium luticellarii]MCI1995116.1 sugar phosphate isomerase/epimerase [Clostridium luticellarii]MCI2039275.1 sugar phosphate isomerase/epimerase [Clostridium luticellarii]PRR86055.1 fructoselysine 3-epimerase [Clostridium luticellarii]
MDIGLSSASFYPYVNTENSIALMKSLGFKLGEIFLNSDSEYEVDFGKMLLEQKLKNDFVVNSIHAFSSSFEPYLFDRYKRRREDAFIRFKKVCKIAGLLGARCYTFHGMRSTKFHEINRSFVFDIYDKLIDTAGEQGVKLCQENVFWCLSSDTDFLYELREKCTNPIYFTLDIKQAYRSGRTPEEYIDIMGNDVENLHLNDKNDENSCLLPGKGEVDYKKILCKLKEIGYNKVGIIEVYSDNYKNYRQLREAGDYIYNICNS